MTERIVYVFLEIPEYEMINHVFTTMSSNPAVGTLKRFQFRSSKSLIDFLNKNKENILRSIPSDEEEILTSLEVQNYLGYLNVKWYKADEQETKLNESQKKILTPEEILDLALKFQGVSNKDVQNYLLERRDDITYEIHKSSIIE